MKFQEIRQNAGYTQESLAKAIGTNRSTVSMWELGQSKPKQDLMVKLMDVLKISYIDLYNSLKKDGGE